MDKTRDDRVDYDSYITYSPLEISKILSYLNNLGNVIKPNAVITNIVIPRGAKMPLYNQPTNCNPTAVRINLAEVKIAVIRALPSGIASSSIGHNILIGYITPSDNKSVTAVIINGSCILNIANIILPIQNNTTHIIPKSITFI